MALITQGGSFLVTQSGLVLDQIGDPDPTPQPIRSNIIVMLRLRVGLAADDSSKDAELNASFSIALALAESYCDRKFEAANDSEIFVHFSGRTLSLRRYPVVTISNVDDSTVAYHVDKQAGLIRLDSLIGVHELQVDYSGGYTDVPGPDFPYAWPPDLLFALLSIFDNVWSANNGGGGGDASGAIKSIRAGDISVAYDTDRDSSGGAMGGTIGAMAASVLDLYARRKA